MRKGRMGQFKNKTDEAKIRKREQSWRKRIRKLRNTRGRVGGNEEEK